MKIKKWSGSAWVQEYPEVDVNNIVATGTPSSSTFLRGDGQWISVDSGNQFVNISGDTMTGNLTIDSASFASLTLDRESTTSSSIVQFTNNGGVVGGIGGFGNDGLQFRTTDGTQMVIDASNRVGIGTTTPGRQLEVNGEGVMRLDATSGDPGIDFQTAGTQDMQFRYRASSDYLGIYSYGTTSDVVAIRKSDGNVGIGTTNTDEKLHIEGNILVDAYNNNPGDSGIFFREGFTASQPSGAEQPYNASITLYDGSNAGASYDGLSLNGYDGVAVRTNNDSTPKMIVKNDGSVQFNGNEVRGKSVNGERTLLNYWGGVRFTWDSDSYGNNDHHSIRSTYGNSWGDDLTINSFHHLRVNLDANNNNTDARFEIGHNTTGTENLLFVVSETNGNVGIGTDTAPAAKLHIIDDTSGSDLAKFRNDTDTTDVTIKTTSGAIAVIKSGGGDQLQLSANGTDNNGIRITSAGNVGIGETSVDTQLHISDPSGAVIKLEDPGTVAWRIGTSGTDLRISHNSDTVATSVLNIDNTGNVGVGTQSPAYAVDVAGDVNVTGNFKVNGTNIATGTAAEPEWEYVTKVTGSSSMNYASMVPADYEYKFVVELQTTGEDNSNPYIRINNEATQEYSYQYQSVTQTAETTETALNAGDALTSLIYTGADLSTYSNGGTSGSTIHRAEFIYSVSPYTTSPGAYTATIRGWAHTHWVSQSGTSYDGMVQSTFVGTRDNLFFTEHTRLDYIHSINIGSTDYHEMRVYRRPRK